MSLPSVTRSAAFTNFRRLSKTSLNSIDQTQFTITSNNKILFIHHLKLDSRHKLLQIDLFLRYIRRENYFAKTQTIT
nr:hypothetical transcript [Hymenolepis microstoma]